MARGKRAIQTMKDSFAAQTRGSWMAPSSGAMTRTAWDKATSPVTIGGGIWEEAKRAEQVE
jgi:hypothetical protein